MADDPRLPTHRLQESEGWCGGDLRPHLDQAERPQSVSARSMERNHIDGLYEHVLESAAAIMRSASASMHVLVPEQRSLVLVASRGLTPDVAARSQIAEDDAQSACVRSLQSRGRVIIPDLEHDAELKASRHVLDLRRAGVRSVQSTPLVSRRGLLVGVLSTYWSDVHAPSERELRDLDVLAQLAADLVDRMPTLDAQSRSQALLRGQKDALEAYLRGEPLARVLGIVLEIAAQHLGGAEGGVRGTLSVVSDDGAVLRHIVSTRAPASAEDREMAIGPQAVGCGLAAYLGDVVISPDVEADTAWRPYLQRARAQGCRGVWSFPVKILVGGRLKTMGVLSVVFASARTPSRDELEVMAGLASAAGVIVAHDRAAQERDRAELALRVGRERQAFLLRLSDAVRTLGSSHDVLATASRLLRRELGVDRVAYWEAAEDEESVVVVAEDAAPGLVALLGRVHRVRDFDPRGIEAFGGSMLEHRDVQGDPALSPQQKRVYAELGIGSYFAVRYRTVDGTIGWLGAHNARAHDWTLAERELLLDVCGRTWEGALRARAEDALRVADRRKDEFLAILSHELRNPLAALRTTIQLLRQGNTREEDLAWAMDVIDRQSGLMSRLIEDLLDVSRITRDTLSLRAELVDLADVVRSALETCRPFLAESGHVVSVTMPEKAIMIVGDPARLAQVFSNLLHNAGKFSSRGGRVSLCAMVDGSDVVVSVRDSGIGIAKHMLGRVFELFRQAETALDGGRGGLGIGLALVKRLVELHGGSVEAFSEGVGHGSEFVVRLPLRSEQAGGGARTSSKVMPAPVRRRVVIVDDIEDAAVGLAKVLSALGYETRAFTSADEAMQQMQAFGPAIALVNLGMPEVSGYELAQRVRGTPWGRDMLLIAVTGWELADEREKSRVAGFDHHMVKPIDFTELARLLAEGGVGGIAWCDR